MTKKQEIQFCNERQCFPLSAYFAYPNYLPTGQILRNLFHEQKIHEIEVRNGDGPGYWKAKASLAKIKTRIETEFGKSKLDQSEDGGWLIPLADLPDMDLCPEDVTPTGELNSLGPFMIIRLENGRVELVREILTRDSAIEIVSALEMKTSLKWAEGKNILFGKWLWEVLPNDSVLEASEVSDLLRVELRKKREKLLALRDNNQIEPIESPAKAQSKTARERISDETKMFVWNRDGARCVYCGSNELLEYDHIIPLALGGSNTSRNLQLLCEPCNRVKGARL